MLDYKKLEEYPYNYLKLLERVIGVIEKYGKRQFKFKSLVRIADPDLNESDLQSGLRALEYLGLIKTDRSARVPRHIIGEGFVSSCRDLSEYLKKIDGISKQTSLTQASTSQYQ